MQRQIPDGLVISTLFGLEVSTNVCNTCRKTKYKHEFYLASSSKRKNKEQIRNQCIDCWSRFKGDAEWGRYILKCEALESK